MKKNYGILLWIGVLITGLVALAGCDSREKEQLTETRGAVNQIEERALLRVGISRDLPPMSHEQDGELRGVDIEVARHIAAELLGQESQAAFIPLSASERIPALLDGRVDILVSNLATTQDGAEQVSFSQPYLTTPLGIVSPGYASVRAVEKLNGKRLLVVKGGTAESYFSASHPEIQLSHKDDEQSAFYALERGEAEAFADSALVLEAWVAENPSYVIGVPSVDGADLIAVGVRKEDTELLSRIDSVLSRMEDQGIMQEILRRNIQNLKLSEDTE